MKRAWMVAALALAGCIDGGTTPTDDGDTPPAELTEDQSKAYEALVRYLRSSTDGDFETYYGIRSAYSKSDWLYATLYRSPDRTILPRPGEMGAALRTEVVNWFNYNLTVGVGKPNGPRVTVLEPEVRRSPWLAAVLRDDYGRGLDENKRIWGGAHVGQAPPTPDPEGLIFEVILYNKDVALHEMKFEDGAWRVNYVLGMGPAR